MSYRDEFEDEPLRTRIEQNPGPALRWGAVMLALVAVEFGALANTVMGMPWGVLFGLLGGVGDALAPVAAPLASFGDALSQIPTLLARENVPNQGWRTSADGGWEGTALGLPPAFAWLARVLLVYAYAFFFVYWVWRGYLVFREHYRYADWTPTDDVVDRLRHHRWGQFGIVIVLVFLVLAAFAPTLGPTTAEQNIYQPYSHQTKYFDADLNEVTTTSVGTANLASASQGNAQNFGPFSYDPHGRWHPFGTLDNGKDLFTYMAYGARVSLFIGLLAALISGVIALSLALLTAYYKGLLDLTAVVVSDSFLSMPRLLVLIMVSVVLSGTWISNIYSGAFVLALLFGFWGWPGLWRAVRGPAFQTVENEWIDAAESYGQTPWVLVKKHVAPFVLGYLLIYLSMNIGGYMIGTAGLSFLGLGVQSPTPEWGAAVAKGQDYITTSSWHISILPGIAITIIVVGLNAMGDGIRDAIDPQSEGSTSGEVAAAGGGA